MIKAKKSKELGGLILGSYIEMNKHIYENCINVFKQQYEDFDMYYFALERMMYAYTVSMALYKLSQRNIKEKYILAALKESDAVFFQGGVQPGETSIQDVIDDVKEIMSEQAQEDLYQYFENNNDAFEQAHFLIVDAYMIEEPAAEREMISEQLFNSFVAKFKSLDAQFDRIEIK